MSYTPRVVTSTVRYLGLVSAGLLMLMVAGCGGDPASGTGPVITGSDDDESVPAVPTSARVIVSPRERIVTSGNTLQMTVSVISAEGLILPNYPVTWSSSNRSCVIVNDEGFATAQGPPEADIVATAVIDGVTVTGSARVLVTGPHLSPAPAG